MGRILTAFALLTILVVPLLAQDAPMDGHIVFYADRDGDNDIYVMNPDGSNVGQITFNDASDEFPVWSPDRTQIAFVSDIDGDFEMYVVNANGDDVVQLMDQSGLDGEFSWSPDGSQIAFMSDMDGNFEIYLMNADGTDIEQLTFDDAIDGFLSWSPDGSQIVFASGRGSSDFEIFILTIQTGDLQQLTDNDTNDWLPAWSPDGSQIAFSSDRDGDFEIYLMNTDGSNLRQLTDNTATDGFAAWSPDSSQITFASDRDGDWEIFVINADGSNLWQITNNNWGDFAPNWSSAAPPPVMMTIGNINLDQTRSDTSDTQRISLPNCDATEPLSIPLTFSRDELRVPHFVRPQLTLTCGEDSLVTLINSVAVEDDERLFSALDSDVLSQANSTQLKTAKEDLCATLATEFDINWDDILSEETTVTLEAPVNASARYQITWTTTWTTGLLEIIIDDTRDREPSETYGIEFEILEQLAVEVDRLPAVACN